MAEQKIEIGGTTKDEVAYRLWRDLRNVNETTEEQLKFYAECRRAALGHGKFSASA